MATLRPGASARRSTGVLRLHQHRGWGLQQGQGKAAVTVSVTITINTGIVIQAAA